MAVLKHERAPLGSAMDWEKPGSDTTRYAEAGAVATMVAGGGQSLLRHMADPDAEQPDRLIPRFIAALLASGTRIDGVLVEGFKASPLPKLLVVRTIDQAMDSIWTQLEKVTGIVVLSANGNAQSSALHQGVPLYHGDEVFRFCEEFIQN